MRMTLMALVLSVTAISCGGGSSNTDGGTTTVKGIPQDQICSESAKAICTKVFTCSDSTFVLVRAALGGTQAACETMVVGNCASYGLQCTGTQIYHADKAMQCRDNFGTTACATIASGIIAAANDPLSLVPVCKEVCTGGGG